MNISLADSSIRMYRRRDGRVSMRLRSYLMIETETTFRLAEYLHSISGGITLSDGESLPFDEIGFSHDSISRLGVMVHDFWASSVVRMGLLRDDVGRLRVDYRISFTGHDGVEPNHIELLVPLLARDTPEDRLWRERWHAKERAMRTARIAPTQVEG